MTKRKDADLTEALKRNAIYQWKGELEAISGVARGVEECLREMRKRQDVLKEKIREVEDV